MRCVSWSVAVVVALACSCGKAQKKSDDEQAWDSESTKGEPSAKVEKPAAPDKPAPTGATSSAKTSSGSAETVDGYQVIRARTKSGDTPRFRSSRPRAGRSCRADRARSASGQFTLAEAVKGLPKQGELAVQIKTSMGSFYCDLYEDKAPVTVANFVGLARGLRKFWDAEKLAWTARPYYDGTTFHRVVPGFMIQGGDHTGTGKGGIGYLLKDELHPSLHHDRARQLCMANRGRDTNEAQFFITEAAAPHLDGSYTIFGQCEPATLVQRIARVPQSGMPQNRPITPVAIEKVEVRRLAGGAAKWMPASAKLPPMPGVPPPGPRGAAASAKTSQYTTSPSLLASRPVGAGAGCRCAPRLVA